MKLISLYLNSLSPSIIIYLLLFIIKIIFDDYSKKIISKDMVESLEQFSKIFLIIFYLIEKQLSKKYNEEKNKRHISKFLFILLICTIILSMIYNYFRIFFPFDNEESYQLLILTQLLFFYILNSIIFEKIIYKHQILSIFMTLFLIILYFYIYKESLFLKSIIITIFSYVSAYSLLLVKYINQKYFISLYILASMNGLIDSIFTLYHLINKNIFFDYINIGIILLILLNLLINLSTYYLFYKIIEKLGPIHAFMSGAIGYALVIILVEILNFTDLYKIIWLIILILSFMIYLEILELNFCGMNHNLKRIIIQRNDKEIETIILHNKVYKERLNL